MARRSEDWNVGLAKDLRDAAFAREFLLASIDEGVDLSACAREGDPRDGRQGVCGQGADGQPERAARDQPRHNPTQDTLNRLLKPFRLRLSLAPLKPSKGRRAA